MINNNNRNTNSRSGCCRNNSCGNNSRGNVGCGNNNRRNTGCGQDCRAMMDQLRAVDFALTETVLYLDAYPDCNEAMTFYCKLIEQRKQLVDAYESQCGPLTMYGNVGAGWDWAEGPWPWEAEAN